MAKVTTSFDNWDFNSQHVQQNLQGGDFIGSHTVIICATAPRISDLMNGPSGAAATSSAQTIPGFTTEASVGSTKNAYAIPLGVVSDFTIQQQRQLQQIFELGSKRSYFVSARTVTSLALSRVFFHGPSLLRMLYAYYPAEKLGSGAGNELKDNPSCPDTVLPKIAVRQDKCSPLPTISKRDLAGWDNFFINLASTLFSQPIGLVLYIKDNVSHDVGAVFMEECNVEGHQMGMSQGAVVLAEGVSIRCDRLVPIRVQVARNAAEARNSAVSTLAPNSNVVPRKSLEESGGSVNATNAALAAAGLAGGVGVPIA